VRSRQSKNRGSLQGSNKEIKQMFKQLNKPVSTANEDAQNAVKRRKEHALDQQVRKAMNEPKKKPVTIQTLENLKSASKKEKKAHLQQAILYGINVLPKTPREHV